MTAKEFDLWSLPDRWYDHIVKNTTKSDWSEKQRIAGEQCRKYETIGRHSYNAAIFLVFFGLFFVIVQFNFIIAIVVSGLGVCFELYQFITSTFLTSKQNEPVAQAKKP